MPRFITIAGRKQVGKDTMAESMSNTLRFHGKRVAVVHFADLLKSVCASLFGIDPALYLTEEGKKQPTSVRWPKKLVDGYMADPTGKFMTVREVLQFVGTDLFRNQMEPDIWANSVFTQQYKDIDVVIVADCRFRNEVMAGLRHGFLVKINRQAVMSNDAHPSETEIDKVEEFFFQYTLHNDGPVDALHAFSKHILKTEGLI